MNSWIYIDRKEYISHFLIFQIAFPSKTFDWKKKMTRRVSEMDDIGDRNNRSNVDLDQSMTSVEESTGNYRHRHLSNMSFIFICISIVPCQSVTETLYNEAEEIECTVYFSNRVSIEFLYL